MKPLVSIITPSYNSEKYLKNYFESILNQDYENYEIIFINDGSKDNTEEIASNYKRIFEQKEKRFVYLKQDNGGQAKAMNLGFPYVEGKYFIWPDSDDELLPNNISEKVKFMEENPDIALGMSAAEYVKEDGTYISEMKREKCNPDNLFEDLLVSKNVVFCPGIFIMRTDVFFECCPNKRINESRIGQNYQILLPVVYKHKYGYIDQVLYKYILHENSHSNANANEIESQISRFEKHERTLYELLDMICSESDIEKYKRVVQTHYTQWYFRLSYKFRDKQRLKHYYFILKNNNMITYKEKIYYFFDRLNIYIK